MGDSSIKEWHAAEEILTIAMSVKNRLHRVWIVLPNTSPIAPYLFAYAYRERAIDAWLFIATFNKDGRDLKQYSDVSMLLDLEPRGAAGSDWAGHSLEDGRGAECMVTYRSAQKQLLSSGMPLSSKAANLVYSSKKTLVDAL